MENTKNCFNDFFKHYDKAMRELIAGDMNKSYSSLIEASDALFDATTKSQFYSGEFYALSRELRKYSEIIEDKALKKLNTLSNIDKSSLENISRNKEVIREINRLIIYPELHPELYKAFNKNRSGGILFYGVPGTGKTRIVKELAKMINAEFFEVKCSDIISKWFGESEGNISNLFTRARSHEKSVIFLDEFEALGTKRLDDSNNPMNRVVSELLTQMQGFKDYDNTLILIAATNKPWSVDSAFLRPGRFNASIHIPLPDYSERRIISNEELSGIIIEGFTVDDIANETVDFNCADVVEFCERLKDVAIERCINTNAKPSIILDDFNRIKGTIKSSVNKDDLNKILSYAKLKG